MKQFFALALAALLSGCAGYGSAPTQYYRAAGQSERLAISGYLNVDYGLFSETRTIYIQVNGETLISGAVATEREFSATYAGRAITADCTATQAGGVKCVVYVDGERAATI